MQSMPRDVDIPCPYTHGQRRAMLTQRLEQRRLARGFSGNWAKFSRTRGWKSSPDFQQNPSNGIGAQFGPCVGGVSLQPFGCKLVCLQLGQSRAASTAIHLHLLHGHRPRSRPDQIQNPKPKILTPNGPFGFWVLDFGVWSLDFGFWI